MLTTEKIKIEKFINISKIRYLNQKIAKTLNDLTSTKFDPALWPTALIHMPLQITRQIQYHGQIHFALGLGGPNIRV